MKAVVKLNMTIYEAQILADALEKAIPLVGSEFSERFILRRLKDEIGQELEKRRVP